MAIFKGLDTSNYSAKNSSSNSSQNTTLGYHINDMNRKERYFESEKSAHVCGLVCPGVPIR